MSIRTLLLALAVILFLAAGVGFGSFRVGSATFDIFGLGLAAFAGSFLFTGSTTR
jgi:lipopolysaccharide export LptBFGC system permease protein LptF